MATVSEHLNQRVQQDRSKGHSQTPMKVLMLGALGVVFGDIGTSPLYAVRETFTHSGLELNQENLFRVLSLVFWLLTTVVTVKYVSFVMRANNKGEGGDFALLALVLRLTRPNPPLFYTMGLLGILGGSLFYADAVITPAISVLSAVEGIEVVAPALHHLILPLTLLILIVLFSFQKFGTGLVGKAFGPVMVLWFTVLAALGAVSIFQSPEILLGLNPYYAIEFIALHPAVSFVAMGAAVLAVTGAEALFADMGHFGVKPIRYTWLFFVLPALVVNYFGQGALLLRDPAAIENPFYLLAPDFLSIPLLVLSAAATVIASQAVISGAFSMTRQAVQLGYLPRVRILHTSAEEMGQVYIPLVNWLMLGVVIAIVLSFQTSSNLAAAYGIAVTAAMMMTGVMLGVVMRLKWHWSWFAILGTAGLFFVIDVVLVAATMMKFFQGGYVPISLALILCVIFTTWKRGQQILNDKISRLSISTDRFVKEIYKNPPLRVPGTAVFMTPRHNVVPGALLHNLKHNKVLHERVILLTVTSQDVPYVAEEDRVHVHGLGQDFYQLDLRLGFKDEPNVPFALHYCQLRGMDFDDTHQASFFLGKEIVIPTEGEGMSIWREHIFAWMKQNASSAIEYYKIPVDRVVELGGRYEI